MRRWLFLGVMVTVLPLGCFGTDSGDADEGAGAQGGAGARGGAGGSGGQGADAGAPATGGTGTGGADDAPPACEQSGDMPFWWAMPLAKESAGILGMALGSNDAIFLTGEYSSRLTLGAGQPNETVLESLLGSRDAFVAKLAPDGSLAWAKHAGGSADDAGHDVQVASDGSLRVVGVFEGTGLFGEGEPGETQLQAEGSRDLFVIELADDGTLEWAKRAGAIDAGGGSVGSALARLAGDDSLRVLGWFSGTVSFGPGEANETELVSVLPAGDIFLASYSADGELEWARRIEGSQLSGGASIAGRGIDLRVDADGTALVVATGSITFAPGEPEETALGGVSVGQYDASGALLGAASAGGGGRLAAAALDADGNVHVGGLFTDSITFGSGQTNETTLEAPAFVDGAEMFLAKVAPDGEVEWAKQASLGQKASLNGLGIAADGTLRLLAQYFSQAELGPGELGAVKLTDGSCLIANYDTDGTVISAKDVSRWHSAMNLPPAPPFVRTLAVSASDGSLRVVGYVGTTDPITLGEGEPGETVIDGVSSWIAAYATCP